MNNELKQFVLELVQSEYETGHRLAEDRNEFNELCRDEGYRATKAMYDLYQKYHMEGLDETATEEFDELIEEALSNKEKLKRAYPELNFDNPAAEPLTEAVDVEDKMQTAVGILYDMDNFVLSVYDNGYWLSMGVPDGEFDENDRDLAEANYKEHEWLIEDEGFDTEAFKDFLDAFQTATRGSDYDQNERARIIHEAEVILNMNESVDDMDKRCEECNTLLNDMGKCPKCDEGEEDLDEAVLNEGPISAIKNALPKNRDVAAAAAHADAKENKLTDKILKNLNKILASSYNSKDKKYYIDGSWVDYDEFINKSLSPKDVTELISNVDALKSANTQDPEIKRLMTALNAVVVDKDGSILRVGLKPYKHGKLMFRNNRYDLLKIDNGYRAEDVVGISHIQTEKPADSTSDSADAEIETSQPEAGTPAKATEPVSSNSWITDKSIKTAIKLLARRKDGSANYYNAKGELIDYRTITPENVSEIFIDKEGTKSFLDALTAVKKDMAKRKAIATERAAIFGESYDDSLEYDMEESEADLDDAIATTNCENSDACETIRADLNDSINELGELIPLDETFSEEVLNEEFYTYADIRSEFEANQVNHAQRESFEIMLVKAATALKTDPELVLIYKDTEREFDPIYFADEAKELQYNVLKVQVFDLEVVRIEFKGNIYIVFRSQADADIYMNYAH